MVGIKPAIFAARPRHEWIRILKKSPGDFIFSVVNSVDDLPDDPQVRANNYVIDFEYPQYVKTQVLGTPFSMSETPGRVRTPAPQFGTSQALMSLLENDILGIESG